jgi:hypothetical protein
MHSEKGEATTLKHICAVHGVNTRAFSRLRMRKKGVKWCEQGSGNPRSGAKHRACTRPATCASSPRTARARPRENAAHARITGDRLHACS